jgi:hypothetical protein
VTLLLAALTTSVSAQSPRIDGPQPSRLNFPIAAESTTLRADMMRSVRPNHWKRGALIGGGIATALLAAVVVSSSSGECGTHDLPCGFVIFAGATSAFLLGALPGALIGSFFPRDTL